MASWLQDSWLAHHWSVPITGSYNSRLGLAANLRHQLVDRRVVDLELVAQLGVDPAFPLWVGVQNHVQQDVP